MLARKAVLVVLNDIIGATLGYIALYLILREFGAFQYGILAFGLGFVRLYGLLTNLGFNRSHLKRVSEGKDLGQCIGLFIMFKFGLLVLFNGALILSMYTWTDVMGRGFQTQEHVTVIYVLLLYINLVAISQIFTVTFNGLLEIAKSQIPRIVGNVIRLVATIFVALTGTRDNAAVLLAWTFVLGGAVELAGALWLFRGYPVARPTRQLFWSYMKFGIPSMVLTSMIMITVNIDKVMLQAFWSAADVGRYAAAQRIVLIVGFVSTAISSVVMPSISGLHSRGEHRRIQDLVNRTERYLLLGAIPPIVLFLTLPDRVVYILLYNRSDPDILLVLALWMLIVVVNTPYRALLQGADRPDIMARVGVLQATASIGLNLLFIPVAILGVTVFGWRGLGAAVATLLTQLVISGYLRYQGYRIAGVRSNPRHILVLPAAVGMAVTLMLIDGLVPATRWYHLAAFGLLGLAVYAGLLFLLRQIDHEDIAFFMRTVHPGAMARYIQGELRGDDGPVRRRERRPPRHGGRAGSNRGGFLPAHKGRIPRR